MSDAAPQTAPTAPARPPAEPAELAAPLVTALATIDNAMHYRQSNTFDMGVVAQRGMNRVLHWPESASPAEGAPISDAAFGALVAASSVGTPTSLARQAQTPSSVVERFDEDLARRHSDCSPVDADRGAAGSASGERSQADETFSAEGGEPGEAVAAGALARRVPDAEAGAARAGEGDRG